MDDSPRDPDDGASEEPEDANEGLPPLPSSLIPRWLAALVLVALVASGVATAWLVLTYE